MAGAAKGTDLVPYGEDSQFLVLSTPPEELEMLLAENLAGEQLSEFDLDRVKVPAGGGTTWEIPGFDGDVATKVIEGIVIHAAYKRAYWPEKFSGGSDAPQCASPDAIQGYGDPGVKCAECPFSAWGTAINEKGEPTKGQACKMMAQLFVIPEDSLLPIVVIAPPSSVKHVRQYRLRLLRGKQSLSSVTTKLSLAQAQSDGGITYSEIKLEAGSKLDPAAAGAIRELSKKLEGAFSSVAIHRDDVDAA